MNNPKFSNFHEPPPTPKIPSHSHVSYGLRLSQMGFGGSPAGGVFGDQKEEETAQILSMALKAGINYIDTSPWYGNGRSEEVIGKALKSIPRKAYYIGTKVGRYEPNVEKMFDFSAERIAKSVDLSLQKLGLDYVDIIQVHDLEFAPSLDIIVNETLPALQKVVDQGKARYIGITCYPVSALKEVIERSKVKINCVLSYARNTLLNEDLKQYMDFFQSRGVGVINAASVAMGLLAQSPLLPEWHPAPEAIRAKVQEARNLCTKSGVDLGRLSVHYSLETPGIATHLMGNSSMEILNLNVSSVTTSLTEVEKKTIKEVKEMLSTIEKTHWEGDDVAKYWSQLKVARGEVPQDPSVKPFL
ncbi:unnamed protein product, partial [Meganyctiphanes norvegica]